MLTVRRGLALLVPLVAVAALALTQGAASADGPSSTYVDGVNDLRDDWADNPTICADEGRCANRSLYSWNNNLVVLWQSILYIDGFLPYTGVDGQFGRNTKNATINWQRWKGGLTVDGIVGRNTWGKADDNLVRNNMYAIYHGPYHDPDSPNQLILRHDYDGVWPYRYGYLLDRANRCGQVDLVFYGPSGSGSGLAWLTYHNHAVVTKNGYTAAPCAP